jgi:hypothetical protein
MKNTLTLFLAATAALTLLITGCGGGVSSDTSNNGNKTAGACGSANGQPLGSAPSGAALCSVGTSSAVTGSGPWSWTCAGLNGGATASCSATLTTSPVNGACGTANGGKFGNAPSGGALCSVGTASAVTGSGPWSWNCSGLNGGTTASCSAMLVTGTLSTYAAEAAACAALPYGSGTIHYFCDCDGPGAQVGCVPGADTNPGTQAAPKKTVAAARALASTLGPGDTIAFCRGGSFPAGYGILGGWTSSGCTAAAPCTIREYAPTTFTASQMPVLAFPRIPNQRAPRGQYAAATTYAKDDLIINADGLIAYISLKDANQGHEPPTQANGYANLGTWWGQWDSTLFALYGKPNANLRILNLAVKGDGTGGVISASDGTSDVTLCNLEMDGLGLPLYVEAAGTTPAAKLSLRGNKIMNSLVMGFLGAANDSELAYNDFEGNGGTNNRDHSIYVSAGKEVSNFSVVGNIVRGQYGNVCNGVELVTHGRFVNYTVDGNLIEVDPAQTTGGCYGIQASNGGYDGTYIRNGVFSRNIIRNGGNTALSLSNCTNCLVENNLVIMDWCYGPTCNWSVDGIVVPAETVNPGDDASGNITIRNNTIWFGPAMVGGANGIRVGVEGSGYTVENNLVVYSANQAGEGVNCFDYSLGLSAYSAIDHNACYSAFAGTKWEKSRGSLSAWRSASGFDAASFTSDPQLVAPGTDFTPGPTSPLLGKADPAHAPATDLTGKTRDAQPDIGALER